MKKLLLCLSFMALVALHAQADEGMWMIHSFRDMIYQEMKQMGLKLSPDDIYNENGTGLSNAIVAVNRGMGTGSMISPTGLMITNYHVAYGDISVVSTSENNYFRTGFWASSPSEEIPVSTTVTFLHRVTDVTDEAKNLRQEMIDNGEWGFMGTRRLYAALEQRYADSTSRYTPSCHSFFNGEIYLMMFVETYRDVRLAGFPPESIGAFGGETDNWGWPQHKGDFALYRVYGDKEGKPAAYAPDNVPLKPEKYLDISGAGLSEGDFTMVIGYPGSVHRSTSSFGVVEKQTVTNPAVSLMRRRGLDVMRERMDADSVVRLDYANTFTSVGNYVDFAKWETICLRRYDVAEIRAAEEAAMQRWIAEDAARKERYGEMIDLLGRGYAARAKAVKEKLYMREMWFGMSQSTIQGFRTSYIPVWMERNNVDSVDITHSMVKGYLDYYQDAFDSDTDREIFAELLVGYRRNVPREAWGSVLQELDDRFMGDAKAIAQYVFSHSFVVSQEKYEAFFAQKRAPAEIRADIMVALAESSDNSYFVEVQKKAEEEAGVDVDQAEYDYQKLVYQYRKATGIKQYPDANSTMRITYGTVGALQPRDAVSYGYRSSSLGFMEKYDPDHFDFHLNERMRTLLAQRDWGRWGEEGNLYINFLSNNDITGGNSGSPILNAHGQVVGLCFDGNRESMASDIYYHPTLNKCVNVDIRYVLWIIEKYADAGHFIDEMTVVE